MGKKNIFNFIKKKRKEKKRKEKCAIRKN